MIVDFVILLAIAAGAYFGFKRGGLLIALELGCLLIASAIALATYHFGGALLGKFITPPTAANAAAFVITWMAAEVLSALAARAYILPKLARHTAPSRRSSVVGAILNAAKYCFYIIISLVTLAALPMSAPVKSALTSPAIPNAVLQTAGLAKIWQNSGIGRDVDASLNFYAISADPESTQRIRLGYTDSDVTPDPRAEAQMLSLLNQARVAAGLKPLTLNTGARAVARAHSRDMFVHGYFSHITPAGLTPFDRMRDAGVTFGAAGENLALAPTVPLASQGLMASPPHRANILSTHFRTVGIGIMNGGTFGLMVTEDFTD